MRRPARSSVVLLAVIAGFTAVSPLNARAADGVDLTCSDFRTGTAIHVYCFFGKLYANPDFYDFDAQPFGVRDKHGVPWKELATRWGSTTRGDPYFIFFEGQRGVSAGGQKCR